MDTQCYGERLELYYSHMNVSYFENRKVTNCHWLCYYSLQEWCAFSLVDIYY